MAKSATVIKFNKDQPREVKDVNPETGRKRRVPYVDDDIFFDNQHIKVGTKLKNYGMLEGGSMWRVDEILSAYTTAIPGEYTLKQVEGIRHLNDIVVLRRTDRGYAGEERRLRFAGIKYSAVWRLA